MIGEFSHLEKEYMIMVSLNKALAQTYGRLRIMFDHLEMITISGLDNPFEVMAETQADLFKKLMPLIECCENSNEMFSFMKDNQLNLSWKEKEIAEE